jgi:succinate dehydrogenase / fumarate reductase cytochrome b subunit
MNTPLHERRFPEEEAKKLPRPFIIRRLHSLVGLWLVVFLFFHLAVNAQAALYFQDDGDGFISAVNRLESLPYLRVVELLILGLPFLIHGVWGIVYALQGKLNAHKTDGASPSLPYKRNRAYSWQRITAWLLVVGIVAHVIHMRFIDYPAHVNEGERHLYMVKVTPDRGLVDVANKLDITLYEPHQVEEQSGEWKEAADAKPLKSGEILAVSKNPGGAIFLVVRETFKSPMMVILYSLLVVASCYHAFNGLWTWMITWGITLTYLSQKRMRTITNVLMTVTTFLGLMAAWGTYWTLQYYG